MRGIGVVLRFVLVTVALICVMVAGRFSLTDSPSALAQPIVAPLPPERLSLAAEDGEAARLTWQPTPNTRYRLCVTADVARQQPVACFATSSERDTAVGIPATDSGLYLLSLQACWIGSNSCSEPVQAGMVGRRVSGAYNFYATALPNDDGMVSLSGFSLTPGATLSYHQAADGRQDQRRSSCDAVGVGACGAETLRLPGALASVAQSVVGSGASALTFAVWERPHAALLFDDGTGLFSGGRFTAQTVLDEFGVKATFFLMGSVMRDYPGAVRALVAAGHRVGSHTYTHPFLTRMTDSQIAWELDQTEAQYQAVIPGGTTKPCFRAPNGAIDSRVNAVVRARGYRQIDWTVGSLDWTRNSADAQIRNVLANLRAGALISFHTQEPQTMIALRSLIPLLQSWGYTFDLAC